MKVVVNHCYGGFSISIEAAKFMADRGNEQAKAELANYEKRLAAPEGMDKKFGVPWYGYGDGHDGYKRDDPDLVAAVEAMGKEVNGSCANLEITEIPDGVQWHIEEYAGQEWIAEKHRTW